ncbi:hypothetical protein, partial [Pseudomonas plecoglossicida]|uniref:hypothetical protein n=1 Tax=Pseudomonas plecoglossicida TaxID=70775 RepID=UPI0034E20C71
RPDEKSGRIRHQGRQIGLLKTIESPTGTPQALNIVESPVGAGLPAIGPVQPMKNLIAGSG